MSAVIEVPPVYGHILVISADELGALQDIPLSETAGCEVVV